VRWLVLLLLGWGIAGFILPTDQEGCFKHALNYVELTCFANTDNIFQLIFRILQSSLLST